MTELERVAAVVADIGPFEDTIDTVLEQPDGGWQVQCGDVAVELEYDEPLQMLMLSAELGTPSEARRLEVFASLLSYALLWRETGGFRAGLTELGGPLWLLCDIGTTDITPRMLAAVVADFAAKTSVWRVYVTTDDIGDASFEPPSFPMMRA